jgi:hypothetical protein
MIDRRRTLRLALAALPAAAWLASQSARAEQAFERLYPFLIDLPGWTGDKPDGMAMALAGMSIMTATRKYSRDGAHLEVGILTGQAAQAGLAMLKSGMKIETSEGHVNIDTVDGTKIARTYTVKDKSGAILVGIADSALLNFGYTGVAEDEALALVKRFDWKAIQAALPKK